MIGINTLDRRTIGKGDTDLSYGKSENFKHNLITFPAISAKGLLVANTNCNSNDFSALFLTVG